MKRDRLDRHRQGGKLGLGIVAVAGGGPSPAGAACSNCLRLAETGAANSCRACADGNSYADFLPPELPPDGLAQPRIWLTRGSPYGQGKINENAGNATGRHRAGRQK
jgi:hypothetical protein